MSPVLDPLGTPCLRIKQVGKYCASSTYRPPFRGESPLGMAESLVVRMVTSISTNKAVQARLERNPTAPNVVFIDIYALQVSSLSQLALAGRLRFLCR